MNEPRITALVDLSEHFGAYCVSISGGMKKEEEIQSMVLRVLSHTTPPLVTSLPRLCCRVPPLEIQDISYPLARFFVSTAQSD